VRQWLTDHGWPADQLDDLVLATSEAVANAVEHGYEDRYAGTSRGQSRCVLARH
jgi:anti-sigma regulatory factor (Ser/Thr protein kinase)